MFGPCRFNSDTTRSWEIPECRQKSRNLFLIFHIFSKHRQALLLKFLRNLKIQLKCVTTPNTTQGKANPMLIHPPKNRTVCLLYSTNKYLPPAFFCSNKPLQHSRRQKERTSQDIYLDALILFTYSIFNVMNYLQWKL